MSYAYRISDQLFALIGYPLEHSFSKAYFEKKFAAEKLENVSYKNFPIENIDLLPALLQNEKNLCGFNVTIPYKEAILPFLDEISDIAKEIRAVNVVKITRNKDGKLYLIGYNTDVLGFEKSFLKYKKNHTSKNSTQRRYSDESQNPLNMQAIEGQACNDETALILGTGGAAKAVAYVLKKLNIEYQFVSRKSQNNVLTYETLNKKVIENNLLIINSTPLGIFPNVENCPPIDYTAITEQHFLFDLVYNPEETLFLKKGKERGAFTQNGYEMLYYQAEEAWKIWNESL